MPNRKPPSFLPPPPPPPTVKFQSEYDRSYTDDEQTAFRFEQFKKNLQLIDSLNNQHPYALFDVTRFADYTDDERSQRRMKGKFADYEQMKAQLPDSITEGAEAALRSYDDVSAVGSDDIVKGTDMEAGQVGWMTGEVRKGSARNRATPHHHPRHHPTTTHPAPNDPTYRPHTARPALHASASRIWSRTTCPRCPPVSIGVRLAR